MFVKTARPSTSGKATNKDDTSKLLPISLSWNPDPRLKLCARSNTKMCFFASQVARVTPVQTDF